MNDGFYLANTDLSVFTQNLRTNPQTNDHNYTQLPSDILIQSQNMVGRKGFEPSAFRLSVERSAKLSYRPINRINMAELCLRVDMKAKDKNAFKSCSKLSNLTISTSDKKMPLLSQKSKNDLAKNAAQNVAKFLDEKKVKVFSIEQLGANNVHSVDPSEELAKTNLDLVFAIGGDSATLRAFRIISKRVPVFQPKYWKHQRDIGRG